MHVISGLLKDCEGAIVCAAALQENLKKIYKAVATNKELDKWSEAMKKKLCDVLRVLKKGIALKNATEFSVVED